MFISNSSVNNCKLGLNSNLRLSNVAHIASYKIGHQCGDG